MGSALSWQALTGKGALESSDGSAARAAAPGSWATGSVAWTAADSGAAVTGKAALAEAATAPAPAAWAGSAWAAGSVTAAAPGPQPSGYVALSPKAAAAAIGLVPGAQAGTAGEESWLSNKAAAPSKYSTHQPVCKLSSRHP